MTIFEPLREGYRGLILALTIAACAGFLAQHYGAPVMLFALLIGMAFNFLAEDPKTQGGIEFASKTVLKIGVALLGFRLSLSDVVDQGWLSIAVIVGLVAATIAFGSLIAPLFQRSRALGVLTSGAVAICGASAALAISAVMPKREGLERDTLFTVVAVTTLSTIAMVAYPLLFSAFGFDDRSAGFLIGATIHDVAQVVGAGYSISNEAGDFATLTKLKRVLLLPVVVLAIILLAKSEGGKGRVSIPPFVIFFIVFMLLNSTGWIPEAASGFASDASRWMLVTAIAALGVKTSLASMAALGGRHIALVVIQTLFLLVVAILVVRLVV